MIRVILRGRLGNNLFQYAAGRMLSEKHSTSLILDASRMNKKVWADVKSLLRLPINAQLMRKVPVREVILQHLSGRKRQNFGNLSVIEESNEHAICPNVIDAPADCVIKGHFQSAKYLSSVEQQLRTELDLSILPWHSPTREMAALISDSSTVAVHIRRTDYLGSSEWDICSLEYYRNAIARIRKNVPDAHFFIFSDDPAWCRDKFTETDQTIVECKEASGDPLHDLFLMSCASHHIIANSSYSWWGAWLGRKPGQIVYCPSAWNACTPPAPAEEKLCHGWEALAVGAGSATQAGKEV